MFTQLVAHSLELCIEEMMGDYQSGFLRGRSTTDQIFSLKTIWGNFYKYNAHIHQLCTNYKQAYNGINRDGLIGIICLEYHKLVGLGKTMKMQEKIPLSSEMVVELNEFMHYPRS
jgi:hypothetical protein